MRILHTLLVTAAVCHTGEITHAQQPAAVDREMADLEARLQEQRAAAVKTRLTLYTDELEKLRNRLASTGDSQSAAAVTRELDEVRDAINRLVTIASGQAEPPATGETSEGEDASPATLAAKRLNTIIERFTTDGTNDPGAIRSPVAGQARPKILKIENAVRNRDYSSYEGGKYWAYNSSYAVWTVDGMVPGDYEVIVRYSARQEAGGTAVIKAAGQKLELTVPPGEKGQSQKELKLNAGTIRLNDPGVDIRVENGGLATDAQYLWDLQSVVLQPVNKRP